MLDVDTSLARSLNHFALRHAWFADLSRFAAKDLVFAVVAVAVVMFFAVGRFASVEARRGAVAAAFALALGLLIAHLLSDAVDRVRPFIAHPDIQLLGHAAHDPGFPSDHATSAAAIAVSLLLRHRRAGLVAALLAVLIAVARVVIGAHYPTDVLGGLAVGAASALVVYLPPLRRQTDRL